MLSICIGFCADSNLGVYINADPDPVPDLGPDRVLMNKNVNIFPLRKKNPVSVEIKFSLSPDPVPDLGPGF